MFWKKLKWQGEVENYRDLLLKVIAKLCTDTKLIWPVMDMDLLHTLALKKATLGTLND
jgi:hypothetical protein